MTDSGDRWSLRQPDGRILSANPALCDFFGYPAEVLRRDDCHRCGPTLTIWMQTSTTLIRSWPASWTLPSRASDPRRRHGAHRPFHRQRHLRRPRALELFVPRSSTSPEPADRGELTTTGTALDVIARDGNDGVLRWSHRSSRELPWQPEQSGWAAPAGPGRCTRRDR